MKVRLIHGVLTRHYIVGGIGIYDGMSHMILPMYWELASWDVCVWLVLELKKQYGGLEGMPYLYAMEALLDKKEEEFRQALEATELRAKGMHRSYCSKK